MTITIREGGYYWRRDGVREGPMRRRTSGSPDYPWIAPSGRCWGGDGRRHYRDWAVAELDLIAEAPAGDGWVFWRGGECPVPPGTKVQVQFRIGALGEPANDQPERLRWHHGGNAGDIIAYRVIQPAPGAPPCDGRPGGEWMAQQLAEKDRRIAFLENALRRRASQLAEKAARIKELEATLASSGATTQSAEKPKRKVETFEEHFKQSISGPIALMSTGIFVRILSNYLEQRLGRESQS